MKSPFTGLSKTILSTDQIHGQLKNGDTIKLFEGHEGYSDGEQLRDFVYIDDVVDWRPLRFNHRADKLCNNAFDANQSSNQK